MSMVNGQIKIKDIVKNKEAKSAKAYFGLSPAVSK